MLEFPNTSHQLAALAELQALLRQHGISYWLFGGWAVDFDAGRVTREHGNLDFAVWTGDRERLAGLLADQGWVHRAEVGEDGYTSYQKGKEKGKDGVTPSLHRRSEKRWCDPNRPLPIDP